MRTIVIRLAGLLLALGLLAVPGTVVAAPAITVQPASGPTGTSFVITGSGFSANAQYLLQDLDATGKRLRDDVPITTDANGGFKVSITAGNTAGQRTVRVVTPQGAIVATATFTVTAGGTASPTPTPAKATLTVVPSSGATGTRFTVTGAGFSPNARYVLQDLDAAGKRVTDDFPVTANASGGFSITITAGNTVGQRTVRAVTPQGTVVASATFSVTAAAMPGLPATGGGGMAAQSALPPALFAGSGLAGLAGLVAGAALRRRAR